MVVVMSTDATTGDIEAVVAKVEEAGGEAFVSRGVERTIIGLVGDVARFRELNLRSMHGVADVHRISDPYKLVSRQHHELRSTVFAGTTRVPIGPGTFTFVAGPCAVQDMQQAMESARMAQAAGATLLQGGAFKPSTSPSDFQGLGLAALEILAAVREATGLPVLTEVVDVADVKAVAEYADILGVGSRSMDNFSLLEAVGAAGKPVLLKRGTRSTVHEWLMAAEYVAQRGNLEIVLCERGIRTFASATGESILDISSVPVVQAASHLPVVVDPSHAAGRRELVVPLARAAIAAGADGIVVDVYADPDNALVDGDISLGGRELRELASAVRQLAPLVSRGPAAPTA